MNWWNKTSTLTGRLHIFNKISLNGVTRTTSMIVPGKKHSDNKCRRVFVLRHDAGTMLAAIMGSSWIRYQVGGSLVSRATLPAFLWTWPLLLLAFLCQSCQFQGFGVAQEMKRPWDQRRWRDSPGCQQISLARTNLRRPPHVRHSPGFVGLWL